MTVPSAFNITLNLGEPTLSAINSLAAAISACAGSAPAAAASTPAANKASASDTSNKSKPETDENGDVIFYGNHEKQEYFTGTEAEFKAAKAKDKKLVKLTETAYNKKLAELEAASKTDDSGDGDEKEYTEQDLIDAFGSFLDPNLDAEEKEARRTFVAPLVKRFGAKKASQIPAEHRALALNLLARHVAGQDVDPANDEFEAIEADDEDGLV